MKNNLLLETSFLSETRFHKKWRRTISCYDKDGNLVIKPVFIKMKPLFKPTEEDLLSKTLLFETYFDCSVDSEDLVNSIFKAYPHVFSVEFDTYDGVGNLLEKTKFDNVIMSVAPYNKLSWRHQDTCQEWCVQKRPSTGESFGSLKTTGEMMGLFFRNSGSRSGKADSCDCNYCTPTAQPVSVAKPDDRNPDPMGWEIIRSEQIEDYLVLQIKYPNCKNYEGMKVLIFKTKLNELLKQKIIDPHFGEDKDVIYPVARFSPDASGFANAVQTVKSVYLNKK